MNKSELIKQIAEKTELTQKDVEAIINEFVVTTIKTLKGNNEVAIAGFGKFVARKRAARLSKNPRTQETIKVPASVAPAFKAGKAFKEALNRK